MNLHEATKKIIDELGISGAKVSEVMGISHSYYGNKYGGYSGNKFNEKNYTDLVDWLKNYIKNID